MTLILSGTDNSVSSPAVQGGTGGTTTGVYYPATNQLALATNGTQAVLVDSSQNVGIGVTPSVWLSSTLAMQLGNYGSVYAFKNSGNVYLNNNTYVNSGGSDVYLNTAPAGRYRISDNTHLWYNAPSGTAGTNATLTQAMTLDASGNLGIGNTSPSYKLDISLPTLTSGTVARFNSPSYEGVYVSAGSNSANCGIGTQSTTPFNIYTNSTQRVQFDNSGNINLKTSNAGIVFNNSNAATNSTLNDYETGSFTPTIANAGSPSYSTQYGIYTKVGNLVFVTGKISVTGATLLTNAITVGGLPFSGISTGDSGQRSSSMVYGDWTGMGTYSMTGRFRINGNTIVGVRDSGGGSAYWYYSDLGSTTFGFNFCLCYIANF
jgi:hypothetical protein